MEPAQRLDRRTAIKWMLAATATISVLDARSFGASPPLAQGYGTDPNLMDVHKPGEFWPLTFTPEQHRTVAALCDVILPADDKSPSASELKVPDFIDEWVSAPYPQQQRDRQEILQGLDLLDVESKRRFQRPFVGLNLEQKHQICDDICHFPVARSKFDSAARFFAKFRNLAMGGFYTTAEGMRDIQYVGNVPLAKFDGPPPGVLSYLHLS